MTCKASMGDSDSSPLTSYQNSGTAAMSPSDRLPSLLIELMMTNASTGETLWSPFESKGFAGFCQSDAVVARRMATC